MQAMDDMALLREYATHNSEAAFAELVSRHVGFVYSAALRQVRDPHLAEEITQAVFIILAQKAGRISDKTILTGWLFKTTRFSALAQTRAAAKRRQHEQEIQMHSAIQPTAPDPLWEQMSPLLDEALAQLGEKDRQAVLLRFFENKSLAEVGDNLGTGEDTARKRVSRALEKLRRFFVKRGVASTTAVIAGVISTNSVQAAPAVLAKSITAVAIAKGTVASGSTLTLIKGALKIMAWTKAKTAIVVGAGVLLTAGTATVTMKKIEAYNAYRDSWRVPNLNSEIVAQAAPKIRILPTKFNNPVSGLSATVDSLKWAGVRVKAGAIVWAAYGWRPGRILFPAGEPKERYDFVSTLPQGSAEALQRELKKELGLAGRRETRDMDVWVLKVRNPGASGLKPPITGSGDDWMGTGSYYCGDQPLSTDYPAPAQGLTKFLEFYFQMPVIDQTGLTQHFNIDLKWNERGGRDPNHDAVKKALLDQLGLDIVPSREPVEMLVMEKVK